MLNGYTYTQMNNFYYCSTKLGKCKAKLQMDSATKSLISFSEEHTHPPPDFKKTASGEFFSVNTVPETGQFYNKNTGRDSFKGPFVMNEQTETVQY